MLISTALAGALGLPLLANPRELSSDSDTRVAAERQPARLEDRWTTHPFSLQVHVGLATPTGGVGVVADYWLASPLSFGCGVGTNFIGVAAGCLTRLQLTRSRSSTWYVGLGVSGGPHTQTEATRFGALALFLAPMTQMREDLPPAPRHWKFAKWLNFETGSDARSNSGTVVRWYLGVAQLLNPGGSSFRANDPSYYSVVPVTQTLLYAGFGLGQAF